MSESVEHWMLPQMRRLAKAKPEAFDQVLVHLREFQPALYEELCLMAVEHGELSADNCAVCLATDVSSLAVRLEIYRQDASENGDPVMIEVDEQNVARLAVARVTVWEIVREHRKFGSLEALQETYTSLTKSELRAALSYASRHEDEIESKIRAYEERFVKSAGV